ncbi:SMI1/KNR4 family protein [Cupriavidus pauculus]|uniref:SMI1/KNR4 family protein n=1 Tax=Cupriavidus pauculus TaxID=82633 RepID=UPI000784C5FC|nr:SMI1/KNR4 family protein [Cupriavidus pauculus]
MQELWIGIEQSLSTLGCLDRMHLRPGATAEAIAELEWHVGVRLADGLKAFLAVHDGQDGHVGLVEGALLLSVEEIRREWDVWRSIDEDEMNADCADFMASHPEGYVKPLYTNRLWIPLTKDFGGNHIGLDYDPDAKGTVGQVIRFGRDEDTKRVIADSFESFVALLVAAAASAHWNGEYLELAI